MLLYIYCSFKSDTLGFWGLKTRYIDVFMYNERNASFKYVGGCFFGSPQWFDECGRDMWQKRGGIDSSGRLRAADT